MPKTAAVTIESFAEISVIIVNAIRELKLKNPNEIPVIANTIKARVKPPTPVLTSCITSSFFSFDPPMVMVGIVPSRYTFELIQNSKDYTINIPTEDLLPAVRICGSKSGRDVNKWELANLTPKKA